MGSEHVRPKAFMCGDKRSCETHSGNEASPQFFCKLVLLVSFASQTQPMSARITFSIKSTPGLVGSHLIARLPCFCKLFDQLSCHAMGCLSNQLSSHPGGCIAFMPFRLLVNHSKLFLPAFKPFGVVSKWDYFTLYNQKQTTSLLVR